MAEQTSEELLALFDKAPLNPRFWLSFAIMAGVWLLDFFDFFLIAFVMAVIGPEWHLTYGQGALILYGAGVGAIVGSLAWGALGDVFGRKMLTVTGTVICGVAAGAIGLLPTGAWIALAILRFFVGFGLAAGVTPSLAIVVEQTPTRWRTGLTSFYVVFASAGTLLASFTAAILLHAFGWRGVALTGFLALIVAGLAWAFVPESVRWLTAKGHFAEARASVSRQPQLARSRRDYHSGEAALPLKVIQCASKLSSCRSSAIDTPQALIQFGRPEEALVGVGVALDAARVAPAVPGAGVFAATARADHRLAWSASHRVPSRLRETLGLATLKQA